MSEYTPTIGLEIHAELKTRTKMFCNSKNDPDEVRPNVNVCPVCMAHPGTLPVINREAVKSVLAVGAALGGTLADYTEFDRKNYFYPDLPKGYQLSQYEYPLVSGGELEGVAITRVHLEEDTAKSMHDDASGETLVDYNRAGVPLMELVTEPVITSAEQAGSFARELQLLLRYLGVAEANMEKGEMRVEANISVAKHGERGTKVEIKNLNSFSIMQRAVSHEIERQIALLESGESVVQETRGWDEKRQATFSQRIKETSADYRYFPDPDLPSLKLQDASGIDRGSLEAALPELPGERRARYVGMGLKKDDAAMFVSDPRLGDFFDAVVLGQDQKDAVLRAANYIANDLAKELKESPNNGEIRDTVSQESGLHHEISISAQDFRTLMSMLDRGELSSRAAKDTLTFMVKEGGTPGEIVERHGLAQKSSEGDLLPIVDALIAEHILVVADFRAGKEAALQFLVGQAMRSTKGAANPQIVRELLIRRISDKVSS